MQSVYQDDQVFKGENYAGKRIANTEFQNCTFKKCNLSDSDFSGNRFIDCVFEECNLSMLKLEQAVLSNALFKDCKIMGVNFSLCQDFLFSVNFKDCLLDYTSFEGKKMPKTQFIACSMKGIIFAKAVLTEALFDHADLQGAIFEDTNLQTANFITAFNYNIDPDQNNIKKASFSIHGLAGLLTRYAINIVS